MQREKSPAPQPVSSRPLFCSKRIPMDDLPMLLQSELSEFIANEHAINPVNPEDYQYVNIWWSPYEAKWGIQLIEVLDPFIKTTWRFAKFWNDANVDETLRPSMEFRAWNPITGSLYDKIYNYLQELKEEFENGHTEHHDARRKCTTNDQPATVGKNSRGSTPRVGARGPVKKGRGRMVSEMDHKGSGPRDEIGEPFEETD